MTEDRDVHRVVTVMNNCSGQLRRAHSDLSKISAPIDSLTKISGVADALDALAGQVADVLSQAKRTTGGLANEVERLRRTSRAMESRAIERL